MTDGFGRVLDYLRISVTELCNYRCRYCMDETGVGKRGHEEILRLEELAEIAAAAVALGVKKIRLTGGEPLVRRGILDLCRMLADLPGLEELTMTTNGSLLSELASELRRAGVNRLNISLDSLSPARFADLTRRGRLSDVLAGIEAAEDAGFRHTKLNAVLLGGVNTDELSDLATLARDRALSVRFIELMPIGVCADWPPERFVSADAVLQAVPGLEPVGTDGVAALYTIPGWKGTVGLIRPMSCGFCDRCSRLRLTADGKLKPCLHSSEEIPLRGLHGDDLSAAILEAAARKPRQHALTAQGRSDSPRRMHEIGG